MLIKSGFLAALAVTCVGFSAVTASASEEAPRQESIMNVADQACVDGALVDLLIEKRMDELATKDADLKRALDIIKRDRQQDLTKEAASLSKVDFVYSCRAGFLAFKEHTCLEIPAAKIEKDKGISYKLTAACIYGVKARESYDNRRLNAMDAAKRSQGKTERIYSY